MVYFIEEVSYSLIIGFLMAIFESYMILKMFRGYFRNERPIVLLLLLLSSILLLIKDIIYFGSFFLPSTAILIAINSIKLQYVFFVLFCYILYLFSEEYETGSIFTNQQMIITIFTTAIIIFIFLMNIEPSYYTNADIFLNSENFLNDIFLLVLLSIIGIFILLIYIKGYKNCWITQKKQIKVIMLGIFFIFFFSLLTSIISQIFIEDLPVMLTKTITRLIIFLGFFILYTSFQGFKYSSLFNRQKAERLLIADFNGMPRFVYDFKEDVQHIDALLFAGAIVAISQIMLESLKSSTTISEVVMKNKYQLMLESRENFIAIIFTPKGNIYLREGLNSFSSAFENSFKPSTLSGDTVDVSIFEKEGRNILCNCFGIHWKELPPIEE